MRLSYSVVARRPTLLHRLTGLTVAEFESLCEPFATQYQQQVIQPRITARHRVRAVGGGQKGAFPEVADKLFFILLYTRIYPLLIVQGLFFDIAESKACKWVGLLLPVLDASLGSAHVRPKRAKGRSLEDAISAFPELEELGVLIDATQRPIRRPKEPTRQQEEYSGKIEAPDPEAPHHHAPQTQYILAASEEAPGSKHDKKLLDESHLTCQVSLPIGADSGFQGLELGNAVVVTPIKRKRKKQGEPKDELTRHKKRPTRDSPKPASALNTAMLVSNGTAAWPISSEIPERASATN
ncbi:MAG: hypothetical protein NVSMB38_36950 [Ktedonobacteraceae bacterium]